MILWLMVKIMITINISPSNVSLVSLAYSCNREVRQTTMGWKNLWSRISNIIFHQNICYSLISWSPWDQFIILTLDMALFVDLCLFLVCCDHKIVMHWYENKNRNNLVIKLCKSLEILGNLQKSTNNFMSNHG